MRRLFVLLVIVAFASSGRLAAQSRPDFSGTWKAADSTLTIRQTGTALTVVDGSESRTYNLDGSDSRFSEGTTQYTARTRWVGGALVVSTTTVSPIGTWEDLKVFSIDYGPTLTVVHVGQQTTQTVMFTETKTYEKR